MQSGDVLSEIRGRTPSGTDEALEMISDLPFNEPSKITIQRGDATKTLSITPTFG
jgi:hypothetical protein